MSEVSDLRASAADVAKWLVDKSRPDDAVVLLSAWAAAGPNDAEGQQLLAEALRIDPSARIAQMAFERMEGVEGQHSDLDAAIGRFNPDELARLEAEMRRPSFRRAQMGYNNNIRYADRVFHVQTEDSGLDQPHIVTHLFTDGGRIIKSHKRSYEQHVARPDVADFVRGLMKAQHLEMVMALREGRFGGVIAGREVGGVELLTEPPTVDLKQLASQRKRVATAQLPATEQAPLQQLATTPEAQPEPRTVRYFSLLVLRSLTGGPERYDPVGCEVLIGSAGQVTLPGELFCHPREAQLTYRDRRLWLEDLEGGNGVFLRIRGAVELDFGDEFVVGDQLLRVERNPPVDDGPDPDPTYFYSSPKWPSSFRVVQIFEGAAAGACVVARGNTFQVGSAIGDIVFPDDPLVAQQHCLVEEQAGTIVLTDLGSRTGVFVRIRGAQELLHADELLIGRTRLVVDLSVTQAA
jgi:pSer/pThr/pTyr-binding forkhead associated (FHA) protein